MKLVYAAYIVFGNDTDPAQQEEGYITRRFSQVLATGQQTIYTQSALQGIHGPSVPTRLLRVRPK